MEHKFLTVEFIKTAHGSYTAYETLKLDDIQLINFIFSPIKINYGNYKPLRHLARLLFRVISQSQCVCIHTTTQNRSKTEFSRALIGVRNHNPKRPKPVSVKGCLVTVTIFCINKTGNVRLT